MFVVFDYNTHVSSRALEVMWNKDSLDTEELLMGNVLPAIISYVHSHSCLGHPTLRLQT